MAQGFTFNGTCKGVTKRGTACQRRTVYANGFCGQHGGDSSEFMNQRVRRLRAKTLARMERLKRKLRRLSLDKAIRT